LIMGNSTISKNPLPVSIGCRNKFTQLAREFDLSAAKLESLLASFYEENWALRNAMATHAENHKFSNTGEGFVEGNCSHLGTGVCHCRECYGYDRRKESWSYENSIRSHEIDRAYVAETVEAGAGCRPSGGQEVSSGDQATSHGTQEATVIRLPVRQGEGPAGSNLGRSNWWGVGGAGDTDSAGVGLESERGQPNIGGVRVAAKSPVQQVAERYLHISTRSGSLDDPLLPGEVWLSE